MGKHVDAVGTTSRTSFGPRGRRLEVASAELLVADAGALLRSEVNSELNFPPNFEGLVLGCIDADFCK